MPEISVIVPVYNAENSIKRCVDSIRQQTLCDLEILLIDDGSIDSSGTLCDSFAKEDNRIRVLHKENEGVSAARNDGMKIATGKYIQFIDSDDDLPYDFCEILLNAQRQNGAEAFVLSGFQTVTDETKPDKGVCTQYSDREKDILYRKDFLKLSGKYLLNSPWNKLFHTDIVRKNQLQMEKGLSIAEDLQFVMQYLDVMGDVPVIVCNTAKYHYYRTGQASLDNCYRANYYKIHRRILEDQFAYAQKWQVPTEDYEIFYSRYWEYMQSAFSNLKLADGRLSPKEIRQEKGKILHDPFFQESLKQKKGTMGRAGYYAMRSRSCLLLCLYEKIYQV